MVQVAAAPAVCPVGLIVTDFEAEAVLPFRVPLALIVQVAVEPFVLPGADNVEESPLDDVLNEQLPQLSAPLLHEGVQPTVTPYWSVTDTE